MGQDNSPYSNLSYAENVTVTLVTDTPLYLTMSSCCLSIVFGFFLIIVHLLLDFQNPSHHNMRCFILYLTLAEIIVAIGNLAGSFRYHILFLEHRNTTIKEHLELCKAPDNVCVVQSVVSTYGSIAACFWTMIIGVYYLFMGYDTILQQRTIGVLVHVICWVAPGVVVIAAISNNVLGDNFLISTSTWCWIKGCQKREELIFWMTICGKMWEMLAFVLTAAVYVTSKIQLLWRRRNPNVDQRQLEARRAADEHYMCMWFILVFMRMWGIVRYFLFITSTDEIKEFTNKKVELTDHILQSFQSVGDSMMAFWNFFVFVLLNKEVRRNVYNRLCHGYQNLT